MKNDRINKMPKILVKETKGITLIALVITIVVLLILAGVVIATLNGNDNIIKNANTAVGKYNEKVNEEQGILDTLEEKLREYTNEGSSNPTTPEEPGTPPTTPTTPTVDSNGLAKENTTIKPDKNSNLQIVIPEGFVPAILQTGTTQSLPGEDGSVKNKMPASQWNSITADDINKGIVVVDADGNEFVWIPITDASKFARTAWTTKYGYDANGSWQTNLTTPHQFADKSTANRWWEDTSTTEYTNMVTSVTHNKGFYVARYEASANSNDSSKAQSKRGATAWGAISQTDAITKSANYNAALHSHLMYGIEWDSILNWLNGNATISSSTSGETKTMALGDLQTNSCSWGNYFNSTGNAATNSGLPQTTGKSEYWKANNIYDLAGNVEEWTQEKYSTGTPRAYRGGSCSSYGDNYPAAYRYYSVASYTFNNVGFRASFYL